MRRSFGIGIVWFTFVIPAGPRSVRALFLIVTLVEPLIAPAPHFLLKSPSAVNLRKAFTYTCPVFPFSIDLGHA